MVIIFKIHRTWINKRYITASRCPMYRWSIFAARSTRLTAWNASCLLPLLPNVKLHLYLSARTNITVYTILKDAIAKGGKENMLTGAERSKTLWELNDRLAQFNKKLSKLCLSIRYYTMADVWNNVTAGMLDRSNAEIAEQALGRWRRCARIVTP